MHKDEMLKLLRDNPVFWSRLGIYYDPPLADENGNPRVTYADFDKLVRSHDSFSDAGVKLHTCILHSGWVGVDRYDYSLCDQVLEGIFASGKTEYFIPRIKLNVPVDWCYENPTEVFVYADGPRDAEGIRSLVGTLEHDYHGYDAPEGIYTAGAWKDPRPNVGGRIARQSFSSPKWLADAGEALRRLIDHLEHSPWADRIIGYHIAYGTSGESMFWGRQSDRFGDYGVTNREKFWQWGLEKYGSREKLLQAWGPDSETEIIPPPHLREKNVVTDADLCRDDVADRWSIDYDLYNCQVNTDALIHFGKLVKQYTGGKAVGCFYGYILHVARSAYTGFLGWKRLLESDVMDFYAAPAPYSYRAPGDPGGEMAPVVSVNRNRLWVDECDMRTHLTTGFGNATCLEETNAVLLREVCKNISHNSGFWFMDLGDGWYDDPDIMAQVTALVKAASKARKMPYRSVAQITVIADEGSILRTHPKLSVPTEGWLRRLQLTGAPVDVIFSHDADPEMLANTKLAVLLNPRGMNAAQVDALRSHLPADATILCCGKAAGEGVQVAPLDATVSQLRAMVEAAGVHCYAPAQCAVYADSRILSFFPKEDMTFVPNLPGSAGLTDMLTGQAWNPDTPLVMHAKEGIGFFCKE